MGSAPPRVVVVHRRTELDELLARHATSGQAEFFLQTRGRSLAEVRDRHHAQAAAVAAVAAGIPLQWRRGTVERDDLDRFLFEPDDIVVTVGQDGLVANVAKYLDGQPVLGIAAGGPASGLLIRHTACDAAELLQATVAGQVTVQARTMVEAAADDGQTLLALNEIYVGHRSHQSARYRLEVAGAVQRQSSSGLIIGTGTGSTGWCASLALQHPGHPPPPDPVEDRLTWFVREAWPSPSTGVTLTCGSLTADQHLCLDVESEAVVVFGDGVETDHLSLSWGQRVQVTVAGTRLRLVA